jgi:hypothetical protein
MLRAKRVDDSAETTDGTRVLVMPPWPRGLEKKGEDETCRRRRLRRAVVGLLFALHATSLVAAPALAEHEQQFRYTVVGYVKDATGKPRAGQSMEVIRQKTGFAYVGETDATGLYVITTRLADESRDERLLVRAGPASLMIAAHFDPADHVSERGTQVDFTGGRVVERAELFPATLKRFLGK